MATGFRLTLAYHEGMIGTNLIVSRKISNMLLAIETRGAILPIPLASFARFPVLHMRQWVVVVQGQVGQRSH